ncbi:NUDIX hydrolase [Candidatus Auribacterota bacterium]
MKEKTLKIDQVYKGRIFTINRHTIKLPGGRKTTRDIVKHPGAVSMVPVLDDGRIVLVKQYRKAVEKELYEIPAGTREKGESLTACVKRELHEETGYIPGSVKHLMSYYPAPGYTSEKIHIYICRKFTKRQACPEEDENIRVTIMKPGKIYQMIKDGRITDGKTIIAMLYIKDILCP